MLSIPHSLQDSWIHGCPALGVLRWLFASSDTRVGVRASSSHTLFPTKNGLKDRNTPINQMVHHLWKSLNFQKSWTTKMIGGKICEKFFKLMKKKAIAWNIFWRYKQNVFCVNVRLNPNYYTLILSRICNIQNNFVNTYIVDVPKPMFSSDFPCLLNNCVQLKMENEYTLILSRICKFKTIF